MTDDRHPIVSRTADNFMMLMPSDPNKDQQSRLIFFVEWLDSNGLLWTNSCLADYRNKMRPDLLADQTKKRPTLSGGRLVFLFGVLDLPGHRGEVSCATEGVIFFLLGRLSRRWRLGFAAGGWWRHTGRPGRWRANFIGIQGTLTAAGRWWRYFRRRGFLCWCRRRWANLIRIK